MTDKHGQTEKRLLVPVEWQETPAIDVPLQIHPSEEPVPFVVPPRLTRSDTAPPFRQAP